MRRVVVVLGGNAFVAPGRPLTMQGQFDFAEKAVRSLGPLLESGAELLLSHGNGPQIGHILTRVEQALGKAYSLPLEVCVAESEGELGYVLTQSLHNLLTDLGARRPVAGMLSQVIVDPDDSGFLAASKPVGAFHTAEEAAVLRRQGLTVGEDAGRGWRRLVPSPKPLEVVEVDVMDRLLADGVLVVAAGGGGIPVVRADGHLRGVEAVVDKDLTGALLAKRLRADLLVILTGVPCAYLNYRTDRQEPIGRVEPSQARRYLSEGHFAPGSMKPKVQAAIEFAETGLGRAIICEPASLNEALKGEAGTIVEPLRSPS